MISIAIYCYMSFKHIQEPRLLNLTGFLLFYGTWCLTDSSLAQLFTGMMDMILNISFVCFMLFSVPMVSFVRNSAMMKTHKLFDYITLMFYGNGIVQMLLHIILRIDMVDMLFATHLCLIAGISLLITDLLREYKKSRNTELHTIITAFVLLFIILLLYRVLITQSENLQARTEMEVYLRLSKIDEMTNLKNRRSFNEDTEAVQLRKNAKANPLLIFFVIPGLSGIILQALMGSSILIPGFSMRSSRKGHWE